MFFNYNQIKLEQGKNKIPGKIFKYLEIKQPTRSRKK